MLRDWILGIPYIRYWGYLLVFFAAFLETLPGIGLFIPGQTIVAVSGFLAHERVLHLSAVLFLAIIGAIIGDSIGFILGRRYGIKLLAKQRGMVKTATALLKQHPLKTLILGRFNSITRAFAPFAAGASNVKASKFYLANITGGILWGTTWVLVGYLVGASYSAAARWIDIIVVCSLLFLFLAFIGYRYLKKHRLINHRVAILLIVNIVSIATFSGILESLEHGGVIVHMDVLVNEAMPSLWNNFSTVIMTFFTSFIQASVITAFSLCFTLLLLWRKDVKHAGLFMFTMAVAALADLFLKEVIMRPRPVGGLLPADTYSFPSGHAFLAVVFFGCAALLYTKWIPWKKTFVWSCAIITLLIAASRVYLGVHWLSDVIGGLALGTFWLTLVFLCYEGWQLARKT